MSRRLLGYVVRQLDGTRSPLTPTPTHLAYALDAWDQTPVDAGDYVVPVFAVRRPMPALVAPVVAAVRAERERVLADLRDRFVGERDDAAIDAKERGEPDYVKGLTWAIDVLNGVAKGQAK